jgi:hypothetical protein
MRKWEVERIRLSAFDVWGKGHGAWGMGQRSEEEKKVRRSEGKKVGRGKELKAQC